MSVKWFDPISERWHTMPTPRLPDLPVIVPSQVKAAEQAERDRLWRAVVSTATSTRMSEEAPCE